ncbi:hypothetical protein [Methylomonas koyamae]|uniref:hypothetical protein n=1 Tax=Methylomonas koyamae TaxID=702114 RepID=UPI0012F6B9C3|nr:hypothetical protein [Methylomonas koyamae]
MVISLLFNEFLPPYTDFCVYSTPLCEPIFGLKQRFLPAGTPSCRVVVPAFFGGHDHENN